MELGLSYWDILLAEGIVILGSVVQGSVGIGLGPMAVPLLVLLNPVFVPGPLLLAAMLLTSLMFGRERNSVDFEGFKWAIAGRVLGTAAGAFILSLIPVEHLSLTFAGMVILAVLINASGIRFRIAAWSLMTAGALSGFMGTISAIGGAPMALIYQDQGGPKLRSTLSAIFIVGTVLAVLALIIIGKFAVRELLLALILMPGIVIGFVISNYTKKILDRGYIKITVLTVSAISALILIIRYLSD